MSEQTPDQIPGQDLVDPQRADDLGTPEGLDGTADDNPIAGVEIDPAEKERAVEPDDDAQEVDGPQVGHA